MDWTEMETKLRAAGNDVSAIRVCLQEIPDAYAARADAAPGQRSEIEEGLGDASRHILDRPLVLGLALSLWLAGGDKCLELAKHLLHFLSVAYLPIGRFPAMQIGDTALSDCELAARRMCALAAAPTVIFGYCLAVLARAPIDPKAVEATRLAFDYLEMELPKSLIGILRWYEDNKSEWSNAPEVLKDLKGHLEAQWVVSESLPRLREFEPPLAHRAIVLGYKRHTNREINKRAEAGSVFAQFATRREFKYASEVAFEVEIGESRQEQTVSMQEFSGWVELPTSEVSDPQGAQLRRRRWIVSGIK